MGWQNLSRNTFDVYRKTATTADTGAVTYTYAVDSSNNPCVLWCDNESFNWDADRGKTSGFWSLVCGRGVSIQATDRIVAGGRTFEVVDFEIVHDLHQEVTLRAL